MGLIAAIVMEVLILRETNQNYLQKPRIQKMLVMGQGIERMKPILTPKKTISSKIRETECHKLKNDLSIKYSNSSISIGAMGDDMVGRVLSRVNYYVRPYHIRLA